MREVLDLFSGACGGWSLGAHRAGYRTVAACEADPWRRAVFSSNFPDVRLYDEVRTLTADQLVRDLGRLPSIIVGSPPCQDASAANTKGRGVDGARTGLFFEAIRLVGEIRPRWCAFENSPRLRTRGVDRVLAGLEEIGYASWPLVVRARDLGAPHERERVWIVAADSAEVRSNARGGPDLTFPEPAGGAEHHPHADREPWGGIARRADVDRDGDAGQRPAVQHDPYADGEGEPRRALHDEVGGALELPREADGEGLSLGEGLAGDALAQLAALERAVGPRGAAWNGGSARHFGVAHGLSARLAGTRVPHHDKPGATVNAGRACISAYGDAVLPQITEAIFRAMSRTEQALAIVEAAE